jgi:hypothetical protein
MSSHNTLPYICDLLFENVSIWSFNISGLNFLWYSPEMSSLYWAVICRVTLLRYLFLYLFINKLNSDKTAIFWQFSVEPVKVHLLQQQVTAFCDFCKYHLDELRLQMVKAINVMHLIVLLWIEPHNTRAGLIAEEASLWTGGVAKCEW